MEQIAVKDLVYESNRKYGKDAGFEQLKESIREYGILEPILARPLGNDRYRVIAGRRRAQAAMELGLKAVDCIIRDDDADDGELALVENINRLEMHPLDEADIFRRMKDAGTRVEYIATYFARSVHAISQRIRLSGLAGGAREMFREGRLDIKGAVLLAGLPEDDQEAFCKKREGKDADVWRVQEYIVRTGQCRLYPLMEGGCADCGERTRNGEGGLFEEDYRFEDVCLNPDCYRETWRRLISAALREREAALDEKTTAVAFEGSVPKQVYGKTGEVELDGKRYEILHPKRYILGTEETNRKKNAYWRIWFQGGALEVTRCGYEKRETHEEREAKRMARNLVEEYGKELLGALGMERQEAPEVIAGDLKNRGIDSYNLKNCIRYRIRRVVQERNLSHGEKRNYAGMYLWFILKGCEEGLEKYTGFKSFESIRLEGEGQRFFHFLISRLHPYELLPPSLEDLADGRRRYKETLFWEYAGMEEDRYRALYLEEGRKVVEHLRQGGTVQALKEEEPGEEP